MESGEAGQRYRQIHIPVAEVQGIDYGCAITQARDLMVTGALEMQRSFSSVTIKLVQVTCTTLLLLCMQSKSR